MAVSDEFFVYNIRRHNAQNDRVWARTREEVKEILVAPNTRHVECVGVFLVFTSKGLAWNIKEKGQSWDGEYFRETVLPDCVLPFLRKRENRQGSFMKITFVHDMAGCFKSAQTQRMMEGEGLACFGSSGPGRWPGNSPDLNPAENVGAIMKERVEEILLEASEEELQSREFLVKTINEVLQEMKDDKPLFRTLLRSFRTRLDLMKAEKGGPIKFNY